MQKLLLAKGREPTLIFYSGGKDRQDKSHTALEIRYSYKSSETSARRKVGRYYTSHAPRAKKTVVETDRQTDRQSLSFRNEMHAIRLEKRMKEEEGYRRK